MTKSLLDRCLEAAESIVSDTEWLKDKASEVGGYQTYYDYNRQRLIQHKADKLRDMIITHIMQTLTVGGGKHEVFDNGIRDHEMDRGSQQPTDESDREETSGLERTHIPQIDLLGFD